MSASQLPCDCSFEHQDQILQAFTSGKDEEEDKDEDW
jgi:hypothetical protein